MEDVKECLCFVSSTPIFPGNVKSTHSLCPAPPQIRCTARIHDIYWQTAEKTIEEERPRIFTAASSSNGNSNGINSINWLQNVPYDQYSANEVGDKYDSQFQGERKR